MCEHKLSSGGRGRCSRHKAPNSREEAACSKDGGLVLLRDTNTELESCLNSVFASCAGWCRCVPAVTMAHRYLQLSAGCRSLSRLLLPSNAPVRLVGGTHANMLTGTAANTSPNTDRTARSVTRRVESSSGYLLTLVTRLSLEFSCGHFCH